MLLPSLRLLYQGCSNSLVLETDALFLTGPPLHKLSLGLQLRLLCLYVPQRVAFLRHGLRLALQLLDLGKGDWRAVGGLRDRLDWRYDPRVPTVARACISMTSGYVCL